MKPTTLLLLALTLSACLKRSTGQREPTAAPASEASRESASSAESGLNLLDAEKAVITVSATEVKAGSFGAGYKVPTFGLQFTGADYAMILRCVASYHGAMDTAIAADADKDINTRKWTWLDAFGNPLLCKVAATRAMATDFQDVSAPNGDFFYLVNPCVSSDHSANGQDQCGYKLALTPNTISYRGAISAAFSAKADELVSAEAQYDQLVNHYQALVQVIASQKEQCLNDFSKQIKDYKDSEKSSEFNKAMGMIGGLAGSVALGAAGGLVARRLVGSGGKNLNGVTPYLVGGAAFAAGASITATIASQMSNAGKSPDLICPAAQAAAKELASFSATGQVEKALNTVVQLSNQLNALNDQFQGYDAQFLKAAMTTTKK